MNQIVFFSLEGGLVSTSTMFHSSFQRENLVPASLSQTHVHHVISICSF